ncbi:sel1 repeat family protein [Pseudomonas sp. B6002]|uniref:tetratricopeptide repeat protein n=1 Tax=Pseudomonas sp. B6002 TaxID=2726978 RepID=UPI0015A28588|nr:SEL1-like repeat protein [Pseudomonas sp. B6002]NVZ50117.1 sel1 repeat family protein [Pseudomonas sp. B6002]
MIALLFALAGCQSLSDMGKNTAAYIKTARNNPASMDLQSTRYEPFGTFDYTRDDSQSNACHEAIYSREIASASLKMVKEGSNAGNATCQHVLGTFYESGNGVTQDFGKARSLYLEAVKDDPYAYVELGRMAHDGVGEPADLVKARDYYRLAGRAGAVALGGMMEHGQGGTHDVPAALKLYVEATQKYGDSAWQAMRPLLARGVELDAEQVQKYNRLWIEGLVRQQRIRLVMSSVFKHVRASGQTFTVTVLYQFAVGDTRSKAYLVKSCGDPMIDNLVVAAVDRLSMKDLYLTPGGKGAPSIQVPIMLVPSAG